jgi:crossover junction endodeoxyribonuclease RuvC
MNVDPLPRALCIMGIDPGLSGAIAWYFPDDPHLITAEDMPVVDKNIDAATLARRVKQMNPDVAVVERVSSMPGQGVSSSFKFGVGYGQVQGVLAACQVPVSLVTPSKWKSHLGLTADKEKSRAAAIARWPSSEAFERKKDHGRAEAALLAVYGAEMILRVGGWERVA